MSAKQTDDLQALPRREATTRRADLDARRSFVTDGLLLVSAGLGIVATINMFLHARQEPQRWLPAVPLLGGCGLLLALVLLRRRISYRLRAWGLLLMGYLVAALFTAGLGSQGSGVLLLVVLPALALVLLGPYSGFVAMASSILVYAGIAGATAMGILAGDSLPSLSTLDLTSWLPLGLAAGIVLVALLLLAQVMRMPAPVPRELGTKAAAMPLVGHEPEAALMAKPLPAMDLEVESASVAKLPAEPYAPEPGRGSGDSPALRRGPLAADHDEGRYARLLETAVEISRQVLGVRRSEELLQEMVDLLVERLGFQHAAVYLVEGWETGPEPTLPLPQQPEPPMLQPVPGPAAGQRWARPQTENNGAISARVPGAVARLVEQAKSAQGAPRRAEVILGQGLPPQILLPLRVQGTLLAVLHVVGVPWEASLEGAAWQEEEVAALEVMADQLAVALENAQILEEAEARLQELDAQQRQYTTETWGRFLEGRGRAVHRWLSPAPEAAERGANGLAEEVWRSVFERVRAEDRPVSLLDEESGQQVLGMPVRLREALIGVLGFRRPQEAGAWQEAEVAAIEGVASRMAFAAENLRLLDEAQRRAAREQALSQMTAHFARSFNMDTVLRAAVRELGQLPEVAEASVYIGESELPASPRGDAEERDL